MMSSFNTHVNTMHIFLTFNYFPENKKKKSNDPYLTFFLNQQKHDIENLHICKTGDPEKEIVY